MFVYRQHFLMDNDGPPSAGRNGWRARQYSGKMRDVTGLAARFLSFQTALISRLAYLFANICQPFYRNTSMGYNINFVEKIDNMSRFDANLTLC